MREDKKTGKFVQTLGARKLWIRLRGGGHRVARCTVERIMREQGWEGARYGSTHKATIADPGHDRHPALVDRNFWAPAPDQLWVADFSYVWTLAGFVYVAFVVDVFSRRILGWRVTTTKTTPLVTDALHQALQVRRRTELGWTATGLVHHSDAGSQYVSLAFTAELLDAGIAGSIGTVGDALDNALCESTIGLFKTEAIDLAGPAWRDRRDVEWQAARWVHWYNTSRLHSSIGHRPPIEFETIHRQATTETPVPEVA